MSNVPTRKVLIIDDEVAHRLNAVSSLEGHLPEGYKAIAPETLAEALREDVLKSVVVALIDKSIGGGGYQDDGGLDENDNTTRGWQVAAYLRKQFPNIYLICFSRANFGEMTPHVDAMFLGKMGFLDHSTRELTAKSLREVVNKAIKLART